MGLRGYTRRAGRCKGGIVRIAVACADAVTGIGFDKATGNVSAVELSEGEFFALYNFKEDTAKLIEETELKGGFPHIRRWLTFSLERLDENEKDSVEELLKKSARGYIILATNGSGTTFVLGYSRKFGGRFPMKVTGSGSSTGYAPEDVAAEVLTFYNEDAAKAPVFTGTFPD